MTSAAQPDLFTTRAIQSRIGAFVTRGVIDRASGEIVGVACRKIIQDLDGEEAARLRMPWFGRYSGLRIESGGMTIGRFVPEQAHAVPPGQWRGNVVIGADAGHETSKAFVRNCRVAFSATGKTIAVVDVPERRFLRSPSSGTWTLRFENGISREWRILALGWLLVAVELQYQIDNPGD